MYQITEITMEQPRDQYGRERGWITITEVTREFPTARDVANHTNYHLTYTPPLRLALPDLVPLY